MILPLTKRKWFPLLYLLANFWWDILVGKPDRDIRTTSRTPQHLSCCKTSPCSYDPGDWKLLGFIQRMKRGVVLSRRCISWKSWPLNFVATLSYWKSAPPALCKGPTTGFSDWLSIFEANVWERWHELVGGAWAVSSFSGRAWAVFCDARTCMGRVLWCMGFRQFPFFSLSTFVIELFGELSGGPVELNEG